jgi:short-subunit dehydrogenase
MVFVTTDLQGKVVIITGASSGIGAAVARECGSRGMSVVLAARREDALLTVALEVEGAGGKALVCPTDLRSPAQIDALQRATLERFERIDILIANAGRGSITPTSELTTEEIHDVIETNLLGVVHCARAVLPVMQAQRSGHIITVSSIVNEIIFPHDALYAATKAGVHRFARGLRTEAREYGVAVSDVLPGVLDTPLNATLTGIPKSSVTATAREIVNLMEHPRPILITPYWYRWVLLANRLIPGCVDAYLARLLTGD